MSTRARLAVLIVLGLVLEVGTASAAPTKAGFIRRGDALCARTQRELVPLRRQAQAVKGLPESQKWAAATRLWRSQIQIQSRFTSRFRALGVPRGDARARGLVAGLGRAVVLARRVQTAFATRDLAALSTELPAYLRFTLALNRRVVAYGFLVCGR